MITKAPRTTTIRMEQPKKNKCWWFVQPNADVMDHIGNSRKTALFENIIGFCEYFDPSNFSFRNSCKVQPLIFLFYLCVISNGSKTKEAAIMPSYNFHTASR